MNNNGLKYIGNVSGSSLKKGGSMSQKETDLTEQDLDIFDQKIEEFRGSANRQLAIIYSLVVALLAAATARPYSARWKAVGVLFGVGALLLSRLGRKDGGNS
jgi:hypothetical protein